MNLIRNNNILAVFALVIILLSAQQYIYMAFLKFEQNQAYRQMHKDIESKNIKTIFTISVPTKNIETELRWKNSHEFFLNGFICDIVSQENKGDLTIFHYVYDKRETHIENELSQLINKINNRNLPLKKKSEIKTLKYIEPEKQEAIVFNSTSFLLGFYLMNYTSTDLLQPNPPPKIV